MSQLPADKPSPFRLSSPVVSAGLILIACVLAYAPALHGKFLWDDVYLVGSNPFYKSPRFVFEVFRHWLFIDSFSLYYRPVQNLTYILDYAIWNQDEFGYHLSNILFHAASAFLLFLVVRRCLRALVPQDAAPQFAEIGGFSIGLLWAVHPIHNAAVAYVAGRADSIAMMFALASWLLFLNTRTGWRGIAAMILAPLSMLAALGAKEIAFIWIALFAIWLFGFERAIPLRTKLRIVGSLLVVFAIYIGLRHLPAARSGPIGDPPPPMLDRIMLMLRALGDYTSLIFFPGNLHMERKVWDPDDYASIATWQAHLRAEYLSLLGLSTIALFTFACWSRLPGRKVRIFGVSWFVLGFLPISNLFPLNAQVAEHWIYMASAGYLLMLAGFVCAIPQRFQRRLAYVVPLLVLALGVRTAFRASDWADPETFFRRTLAAGGSPERVSVNLADVCANKGNLKEAEQILRSTVAQFPGYATARIRLGMVLQQEGVKDQASNLLHFSPRGADIVAKTTPQSWHAALQLAEMLYRSHQPTAALATMDDALKRYPDIWELIDYRAEILEATTGAKAALPSVADFVARHWWHFDSHLTLARLDAELGDTAGTLDQCREAASLDVHSPRVYDQAALVEIRARQWPQALQTEKLAISEGPASPEQFMVLSTIYTKLGQPAQAMAAKHQADALTAGGG